ncbi:MAG: ABC transporter permease, partial [Actinomycetota bacterium]|nr:ABC transporter permease [Actinomycetota bacterium]
AGGPRYPAWLALPALAYYAVFFLIPLALMAAVAFAERVGFVDFVYALNVKNFTDLWDPLYRGIFINTFKLALTGTVATLLVGFPLAYYIARHAKRKTLLLLLIVIPFWTSFLIRTYAWLIILDPDFPAVRALRSVGILPEDFSVLYTPTAVYIGVIYTYLPLMVLPVYAALERMDWSLVEAAQDLGDSAFRAFSRITLPLTLPGVIAGSLLVFIPMMGEFLNPVILGGDKTIYVGNLIGLQFGTSRDWPFGAAIAMVLIAAMTVIVLVYSRLVTREEQFGT